MLVQHQLSGSIRQIVSHTACDVADDERNDQDERDEQAEHSNRAAQKDCQPSGEESHQSEIYAAADSGPQSAGSPSPMAYSPMNSCPTRNELKLVTRPTARAAPPMSDILAV